jgi:DNA polymerase (family 10)
MLSGSGQSQGESSPSNRDVGAALAEVADLLDLKGESSFKVGAYRRAADSVARSQVDVAGAYRDGQPPALNGVGASISERIREIATTGTLGYLEDLRAELPPSLMTLLAVPGVGPRTAGEVWRRLGIATLPALEAAARAGELRSVRGINARTEARIVEGIGEIERRPPRRMSIREGHDVAAAVAELISALPDVTGVTVAGSVRRGRETIGDIDVLVETAAPEAAIAAIAATPAIEGDVGAGIGGSDRSSLQLKDGPQLDVLTVPPGSAGSYLVHFTGSAAHNVKLRHLAKERGWSLSEKGITELGLDPDTRQQDATLRTFPTEAALYEALGLDWIEPELREGRAEIEAAAAGDLPELVKRSDLRGDCHSHSHWSDGRESLEAMVESARRLGHAYLVLSDHSQSLTIANGLTPERVEAQRRVIGELNERFAREEEEGVAPADSDPGGFRLLHGCELEITTDGRLDYDDRLLERFDVVLASLHVGRGQPRAQLMARYETALRSPHVDIITHPSGRKIDQRPDLDLDWESFYGLAAETGTLLEINGSEERLDLDEDRVRSALAAGCAFTIDSDAHDREEWRNLDWGVAIARRGWLRRTDVANTLELSDFLALMAEKPHRLRPPASAAVVR